MSEREAGRDLDIEVLRRVFGVKKIHYNDFDTDRQWPMYIPSGKPWRTHQIDSKGVPLFSDDMNAAWALVERMRDRGWWPKVMWLCGFDNVLHWRAYFDKSPLIWDASAPTAPLAICRAALAALDYAEETDRLVARGLLSPEPA